VNYLLNFSRILVFNTYNIFTFIKIFFYSSYSETNTEPIKGEMGISLEMEETMKNMMVSYELSDSSTLSESLIKLMDEVKALNCC
jgi:hypothetical protein